MIDKIKAIIKETNDVNELEKINVKIDLLINRSIKMAEKSSQTAKRNKRQYGSFYVEKDTITNLVNLKREVNKKIMNQLFSQIFEVDE